MLLFGFLFLGMIAGLLAGLLGIGGGIIIIPGLIYLFKSTSLVVEQELMHIVLGSSLASIVLTSAIAIAVHARANLIRWDIARKLIPGLIVGAMIGPYVASQLNTQVLLLLFSGFLMLLALRFIFNWHSEVILPVPATPIMYGIGVVIGAITSMLGLGGGLLLIPFLSYLPLSIREISALSLVCIFPVALLATLGYIIFGWNASDLPRMSTGYVYWPAVLPLMLASGIFTPLGIAWSKRVSTEGLKKIFGYVVLGLSLYLILFG